ncbi:MAG: translation initiation factor [Muribaculaceae bacterium]|nr:translation initiation factor [Muribaculaceae bacterium]
MEQDWKNALYALRQELPQEPDASPEESMESEPGVKETTMQKERLRIIKDRKGRNGKTATIIEGFTVSQDIVEDIARKIKQKLGVGGSIREGEILIQGDHTEQVKKILINLNFKV